MTPPYYSVADCLRMILPYMEPRMAEAAAGELERNAQTWEASRLCRVEDVSATSPRIFLRWLPRGVLAQFIDQPLGGPAVWLQNLPKEVLETLPNSWDVSPREWRTSRI